MPPFTFISVTFLLLPNFAYCVNINEETLSFIQDCICKLDDNPKSPSLIGILNPPMVCIDSSNKNDYFLPKILLWCPITQFGAQYLHCPQHKACLKACYWQNTNQVWRQPRHLYDTYGNVLLIARNYICTSSMRCRILSTDPRITAQLSKRINVPFALFHKAACTNELLDFIYAQIAIGVTFNEIARAIQETNYAKYGARLQHMVRSLSETLQFNATATCDVKDIPSTYRGPSSDFIEHLFLQDFQKKQILFTNHMQSFGAEQISLDHTFKVTKNIGILDQNNQWKKQYETVLIVMNEDGYIISWAFTKSAKYREVQPLFRNIQKRLTNKGQVLRRVYIDNCCSWRKKLQKQFGSQCEVKLDLFHAVKRVTGTIRRKRVMPVGYKSLTNDFAMVFRRDDDQGKTRSKCTPSSDQVSRQLGNFINRWQHMDILNDKSMKQIDNLRLHINNKCLEDIPPGHGTERNENLHRIINGSLLSHARKIGPELAFAVLTVIFYYMNKRKQIQGNGLLWRNRVELDNELSTISMPCDLSQCEQFGFIGPLQRTSDIVDTARGEIDFSDSVLSHIISRTLDLKEIYENIINKSLNKDSIHDFGRQDLHGLTGLLSGRLTENSTLSEEHTRGHVARLERELANLQLQRVPIPADGDCAFVSILDQIRRKLQMGSKPSEAQTAWESHLTSLGLHHLDLPQGAENVLTLRKLFVDAITGSDEYRVNYTNGMSQNTFKKEAYAFLKQHTFSGQLGDLVIKVLSIVLCCPIVIVTSMEAIPILTFVPQVPILKDPLYIAFSQYGPGHYDSTEDVEAVSISDFTPTDHEQHVYDPDLFCRCGSTQKGKLERLLFVSCTNISDISPDTPQNAQQKTYKSRCRCFKNKQGCLKCGCHNCANPFNSPDTLCSQHKLHRCLTCKSTNGHLSKSPKRQKSHYKKSRGSHYMTNVGEHLKSAGWNVSESCLLEAIMSYLSLHSIEQSIANILRLFNSVNEYQHAHNLQLHVNKKTQKQLNSKLMYRSSTAQLSLQCVATQLDILSNNCK